MKNPYSGEHASAATCIGGTTFVWHRWHTMNRPGHWLLTMVCDFDPDWILNGNYNSVVDDFGSLVIVR